jgi:hypothetical protein
MEATAQRPSFRRIPIFGVEEVCEVWYALDIGGILMQATFRANLHRTAQRAANHGPFLLRGSAG